MKQRFFYGGQAVIEGVLIRGRRCVAVAVRRPTGEIATWVEPLGATARSRVREVPFLRGILVLAEMLSVGVKALLASARIAGEEEGAEEISPRVVGFTLAVSVAFAIALFFVAPTVLVRALDSLLPAPFLSDLVEGAVRLAMLVGYILLIGRMADVQRVFAYHGAEHMTVHALEHGEPLEVPAVRRYGTAHERCGTAFLLTVMVVAVLVFAVVGRPEGLGLRLLSRIALVPVVAAVAYEIVRLSATYAGSPLVRLLVVPNLALQSLTTRPPDDGQIEVAIAAMRTALDADDGRPADQAAAAPTSSVSAAPPTPPPA